MPEKARLKGWKAIGGKSRRYRNAKGETISRREYENRVLRKQGWKNRYEAEKFRKTQRYRQTQMRIRKATGKRITIFDEYSRYLSQVDFDVVNANWDATKLEGENRDMSPNGLLAQNLTLLGLRRPEWEWDVGETPAGISAIG